MFFGLRLDGVCYGSATEYLLFCLRGGVWGVFRLLSVFGGVFAGGRCDLSLGIG